MILYTDVTCRVVGGEQGCSLISAKTIYHQGSVPQAMGGRKGGGGGTQTVTQNTAPWAGQQPFLSEVFSEAQKNFAGRTDAAGNMTPGTGPQAFYPGQTFAPFSAPTEEALRATEARATEGSPLMRDANYLMRDTIRGDFLPKENYDADFNRSYEAARNTILPDIQSRFARSGRYGSGLSREAEARALGDVYASQKLDYNKLFQDRLARERTNQMTAMGAAPGFAEQDYADINKLAGVGAAREGQEQSRIDEEMARHAFAQAEPSERLARYMSMLQGNYGGQSTTQNPFYRNKGAGILGGANMGATAGAPFGPWGAGIGGVLGGLLGGLF